MKVVIHSSWLIGSKSKPQQIKRVMFICCASFVSEVYGASLYSKFVFFYYYLFIPYSVLNDHIRCFIKLGKRYWIIHWNLCVNKLSLRILIVDASKYYVERFISLALCKFTNFVWFNNCHFSQKRSLDRSPAQRKKLYSLYSKSYKLSQHRIHVTWNTEFDQALIFL